MKKHPQKKSLGKFIPFAVFFILFLGSVFIAVLGTGRTQDVRSKAVEPACGVKTTKLVDCRQNWQMQCCASYGCTHYNFEGASGCPAQCPREDKGQEPVAGSCRRLKDECDTVIECTPCQKTCTSCVNGKLTCDDKCNVTTVDCASPTVTPLPTQIPTPTPQSFDSAQDLRPTTIEPTPLRPTDFAGQATPTPQSFDSAQDLRPTTYTIPPTSPPQPTSTPVPTPTIKPNPISQTVSAVVNVTHKTQLVFLTFFGMSPPENSQPAQSEEQQKQEEEDQKVIESVEKKRQSIIEFFLTIAP